ncbi:hypothetical protein EVAR_102983_1 [Eumeta japonica]|uniref:Uncharacterized protein n=1 Tax=Eumeta variegata TaxID=151549 RepID=A0A4C1UQB8_EUMVA|nr:hypothetical protein EVAR_102983_1 [Eumeta japonica]
MQLQSLQGLRQNLGSIEDEVLEKYRSRKYTDYIKADSVWTLEEGPSTPIDRKLYVIISGGNIKKSCYNRLSLEEGYANIGGEIDSQKQRHPSNFFLQRSHLELTPSVHFWSHHGGDRMPPTEYFFSGYMSLATDTMAWNRTSTQEVRTSQDKSWTRSGEQKYKSNALGFECGLTRCVGVSLFRMKRLSLSIMSTKVLPAASTPLQPQRESSTLNFHGNCLETIAMGRDTNLRKESMISNGREEDREKLHCSLFPESYRRRSQDFLKKHRVDHTASRRGSFDPLAINDK